MDAHRTVYRAIALRDEWIVAVAKDLHGLDSLIMAGTQVLDDPQLTVLPAFYQNQDPNVPVFPPEGARQPGDAGSPQPVLR
jgi:hypothetical protein